MTFDPHTSVLRAEEFALLVESVEDYAIFFLSPEGEIRSWNRGAHRLMGYSEQEAVGKHFSIFYGPDDLAARKPQNELESATRNGRVEDEGWRVRQDGKRFWANTVITVLRNDDGSVRGFAKVTRDMTARRAAEDAVRQTAEIFQLLVESVREYAIFLLDVEGRIATWNNGAQRIKGYTPDEIIGKHFSVFYTEEDQRAQKPQSKLAIAREKGSVEDEGWRVRKDGTRFWANIVITAVYDSHGTLRGFTKVTRDLTEQKKAREELRQSLEIFQLLVSSVREYAIFMLDPEGYIATWNAGAQGIKGYTPEEIIGKHFSTFYGEEDRLNRKPERELEIARERGSVEDEGWRIRKDGTRFWANVVITAVYDSHGELRGFTKVTRDMTERKNAEETQRALYEQREARLLAEEERRRVEMSYRAAQEANRAKDEFLMTLSHELRTPMTAIVGWARLLPGMSPTDSMFREAIEAISGAAQLQARLIDDILDVSRIVSGKLRLAPETIDIGRVIGNAVDAVAPTAAAKRITVTSALSPALGTLVADSTRIQQVVWNLLSNAVKSTPSRGVNFTAFERRFQTTCWMRVESATSVPSAGDGVVTVSALRTGSYVQIVVQDTGEGIDPQFLPHVFEPFRQAETPHTRVHGGLGLGLSIVRYIAEAHGGSVTAASEGRGKGATFTVTLPVHAVATNTETVRDQTGESIRSNRLHGVDVVLVDDDRESRRMVTAVLRSAGANIVATDSAAAALDAVERYRPHVVITDIAMPDVDGYALTRALRQREYGPQLQIVALSAFPAAMENRDEFDAYLAKPIDPFHLVDEIARIALRRSA